MGRYSEESGGSKRLNCGGGGGENDGLDENSKAVSEVSPNSKNTAAEFWYDLRYFPDSLLVEILIRLPIKSLFRNKQVCKPWLSLISHVSFERKRRLNANSYPFRIMYKYVFVSHFRDVVRRLHPDVFVARKFSVLFLSAFELEQPYRFKVMSVSNGLVMFSMLGRSSFQYYVCDPVTGECVVLPRWNMECIIPAEGLVSRVNEDNRVIDYKVVVVVATHETEDNYLALEVFFSESGVWSLYKFKCPRKIQLLKRGCGPINFNGILHWFEENGMVAFDPYRHMNGCWLIPFPHGLDMEIERKHDGLYRLCDGVQGKLKLFEVAPEPSKLICFRMWVIDDYEKREWVQEFEVTRIDLSSDDERLSTLLPTATFIPLSFNPFNSDVVYLRCVERSCIVTYNIKARRLDVSCELAHGITEDLSWRVVVPAVAPIWPTPLPAPSPIQDRPAFY